MTHGVLTRMTHVAVSVVAVAALAACSADNDGAGDTASQTAGDAAAATSAAPGAEGAAAAAEPDLTGLPEVVATVNGEDISKDDFVSAYEPQFEQSAAQAQQAGSEVDQADLKQQTLDFMINNLLLRQAANDEGIEISDSEVDADIEELAASNGAASAKDFLATLEEQGFTEDEVRDEVENQLKIEKYLTEAADVEQPSGAEIRDLYDQLSARQESSAEDPAAATIPAFDEVESQLEQQLLQEAQSEAVDGILSDLRAEADITSNL